MHHQTFKAIFSPEVLAGLDSGIYYLSQNSLGYTVSVGDGTKLVASGALTPVSESASDTQSVVSGFVAVDRALQWYYLGRIHKSLEELSQRTDQRYHDEQLGKCTSISQELLEWKRDHEAGADLNRLGIRLDSFVKDITQAIHTLRRPLHKFSESVRQVEAGYDQSWGSMWSRPGISKVTAIVDDFEAKRQDFDVLFTYLSLNIFVRYLQFALALSYDSPEKVKGLASTRLQEAIILSDSLRSQLDIFDRLITVMEKYLLKPEKGVIAEPVPSAYRFYYSLSGNLAKLEQASISIKAWKKQCLDRLDEIKAFHGKAC